jgi:flavin-binding protein dodecin
METYVVLRRGGWTSPEELDQALARSVAEGDKMADEIRWLRSYVLAESNGGLGTACIYEARNPEAIRRHASRAVLPVDEILEVAETVIVQPGRTVNRRRLLQPIGVR